MAGQRPATAVESVFREDRGRLVAALAPQLGDLDLAEEVASEAFEVATRRWPQDGVPEKPLSWLLVTARRKAVDRIRRDRVHADRLAAVHAEAVRVEHAAVPQQGNDIPDDRLTLFFTCCHPALPMEEQLALTLRFLGGLSTAEVARALLVPVPTMAKRLTRAKHKIRNARIPFRVPAGDQLDERLAGVLGVVYLLFNEGYATSSGAELVRDDVVDESIRLARVLHRLMPGQHEVAGLLALMLLTDARRPARVDGHGVAVSLENQDRDLWDAAMITEGKRLLPYALGASRVGPYAVQAAIAALHDEAADTNSTDWPQIVALYDVLGTLTDSPLVALSRALAVAMRDGPEAGLALLDEIGDAPELREYHPWFAARGYLLGRLSRGSEARAAYRKALGLVGNEPERAYLEARLAELE